MLINLRPEADVSVINGELTALGQWTQALTNADGIIHSIYIKPSSAPVSVARLYEIPGVVGVLTAPAKHPLVDEHRGQTVRIGAVVLGDDTPVVIAGPCGLDSERLVDEVASAVASAGATVLRGGAFKPRTSPYAFNGHGLEALRWMRQAADRHGLAMISEVLSEVDAGPAADLVDMVQIGSRNMQNFALLRAVGCTGKPVLLKRGRAATIEEWILAAEHLYASGSGPVVFCERGVRGFDAQTRNLLDLAAVAVLRHQYDLPVIVDPSHATGRRDLIVPLGHAAISAGAHGVMVEVNPKPETALSDGPQALDVAGLTELCALIGLEGSER
jgi:3-deoxy-7-phosphoheptulonate synthase